MKTVTANKLKTSHQKGVYYLGVKVFNMLPPYIKTESDNPKKFKVVLQKFLHDNSFYLWRNSLNFKKLNIHVLIG
jgi:hypothetical protein